jgi:hypothetical protein
MATGEDLYVLQVGRDQAPRAPKTRLRASQGQGWASLKFYKALPNIGHSERRRNVDTWDAFPGFPMRVCWGDGAGLDAMPSNQKPDCTEIAFHFLLALDDAAMLGRVAGEEVFHVQCRQLLNTLLKGRYAPTGEIRSSYASVE